MNFAFFHTKGATGLLLTSPQRSDPGPRWGSVVVHRVDVFGQSLAVMALLTHRLPVGFVPEKSGIATVRCDMVHHGGFRVSPLPHALGAERMGLEVLPAYFLPLPCIATLTRWACDFRVQRQVLCTVKAARLNQLRATGVPARHLGSAGHGSFLPRQAGLAEVTVGTDLVIVHVQQTQTLDNTLRGQVVAVLDVSLDEVQRLVFRAEALHRHAHRL